MGAPPDDGAVQLNCTLLDVRLLVARPVTMPGALPAETVETVTIPEATPEPAAFDATTQKS